MFPTFLPPQVKQLRDASATAFAQSIQRTAIVTSLHLQPILTTYVHEGTRGTPILLLHGFDSSILEFRLLLPLLAVEQEAWAVDLHYSKQKAHKVETRSVT